MFKDTSYQALTGRPSISSMTLWVAKQQQPTLKASRNMCDFRSGGLGLIYRSCLGKARKAVVVDLAKAPA